MMSSACCFGYAASNPCQMELHVALHHWHELTGRLIMPGMPACTRTASGIAYDLGCGSVILMPVISSTRRMIPTTTR